MANLSAGSIAFTGFNADGADGLSFVVLQDVVAGTVITFTDNPWTGTAFNTKENTWTWTAGSDIAAGAVVTMDNLNAADNLGASSPSSNLGSIAYSTTNARDLANLNEGVYAYVGDASAPTFLAAIGNSGFTSAGTGAGVLTGTGLVNGQTVVNLAGVDTGADIAFYDGPRDGFPNYSDFLASINNAANWITQDTSADDSHDGTAPDLPFSTSPFVADPTMQTVSFATDSVSVSHNEGDAGTTTTYTFTVQRTNGTTGEVDFSGTVTPGTGVDAADFGGTIPATFSGTIADGATSGTVTITVAGDIAYEANETFGLKLTDATNAANSVNVGGQTTATGTIVNDDTRQIIGFSDATSWILHNEGGPGTTTTYTFTIVRTGGTTGDVTFTAVFSNNGSSTAADFGGTFPANFTGVIPDGQDSYTFSVTTTGDDKVEADHSFTWTLTGVTNDSGITTTTTTASVGAGGVMVNDDFDNDPFTLSEGEIITNNLNVGGTDHYVIKSGGAMLGHFVWSGANSAAIIDNDGAINAAVLENADADGTLTINNKADGTITGNLFQGTSGPRTGTATFIVNNDGTMINNGGGGGVNNAAVVFGGDKTTSVLTNSSTGVITSNSKDYTIFMSGNTTINNAGQIINTTTGDVIAGASSNTVVHNEAGGLIQGNHHAVTGQGGVTVINDAGGTMIGLGGSAVNIDNNGDVENTVHVTNYGLMQGGGQGTNIGNVDGDAVDVDGLAVVENYGRIAGVIASGLHDGEGNVSEGIAIGGGTINNYAGGEIYGYGRAIQVDNSSNGNAYSAMTITNAGLIQGDGHLPTGVTADELALFAARITGGEAIDIVGTQNDSLANTGTITGGVKMDGGDDVLTNSGTMTATGGSAVNMGDGNDTVTNTGTITGAVLLGAGDDTINVSVGSTVTGLIDGGDGNDVLHLTGMGEGILGNTANIEEIDIDSGSWTFNSDTASAINIAAGVQTVRFTTSTTADGDVDGVIKGFIKGESIDLQGIGLATSATLGANNVLTIAGGANGPVTIQLDPAADYSNKLFNVASDGNGGTNLTISNAAQTVSFATTSRAISQSEGDSGPQTVTFTVQRAGGTAGDLHFSIDVSQSSGLLNADDFGGTFPGAIEGVILDGQTTATFTLTYTGDTRYEATDVATVQLVAASNDQAAATVARTGYFANLSITNDDAVPTSVAAGEIIEGPITLTGNATFEIEAGGIIHTGQATPITWSGPNSNVVIENSGTIEADTAGSISVASTARGTLVINNHIGGQILSGVDMNGQPTGSFVTINNEGLITDDVSATLRLSKSSAAGAVINNLETGVITASNAHSSVLKNGGNVTVNNWGKIVLPADTEQSNGGDAIDFDKSVNNTVHNYAGGLIEGSHHAVTGSKGITVINDAGGTMIGRNGSAVNMDNDASAANTAFITNHGDMEGRSAGYDDSDGDAIDVDGLLHLDNYGQVKGLGANGTHDGGANVSEGVAIGGGEINNYAGATIYGYGRAIQVDNSANGAALGTTTIYNEGTIQGDGHGPQNFEPGSDAGIVIANREAVDILGTFDDTIINKGQIIGGVFTDGGNDTFNLYAGSSITGLIDGGDGNDTLHLLGAGAGTLGVNQNIESLNVESGTWTINKTVYTDVTVATGATVMSQLELADQGTMSVAAGGLVLVANGDDAVVADGSATIENSGAILGIGASASAIAIDGGSIHNAIGGSITGNAAAISSGDAPVAGVSITNEGVIQGLSGQAISLADQADTLTNRGQILGGVSLGGGDDTLNVYTGSNINGAIDLGAGTDSVHLLGTGGSFGAVANAENLDVDQGVWAVATAGSYNAVNIAAGATLTSAIAVTKSIDVTVGGTLAPASGRAIDAKNGLANGSSFAVDVLAGGQIVAGDDAIRINKSFDNGTVTVDNAGLIKATGGQAIDFTEVTSHSTTITITNEAGGLLLAVDADAVRGGGNSTIENYGQIISQATGDDVNDGIDFQDDGDGTVTNHTGGSIIGAHHGITGSQGITVVNELGGTIVGQSGSAVNIDNDSAVADMVTVTNRGVMLGNADANQSDSDGDAVDVDGLLNLDNFGQISGTGAHGYHDGTAAEDANISEGVAAGGGTIRNELGATISGYGRAIQIDDSSNGGAFASTTIINDGLIQGGGHGPEGVDPADAATMQAKINGAEAIDILGTFADTISNSATGKIVGGIFTDGGNDTLSNDGMITALAGSAINMGDGDDTVTNTGLITGNVLMGAGDDTFNASAGSKVTKTIDLGDGNDTVNLYAGSAATGTLGTVINGEILNVKSGTWSIDNTSPFKAIDVADGATVNSMVILGANATLTVEQGGSIIGSTAAVDILGGTSPVTIVNSGTIKLTGAPGVKFDTIVVNSGVGTIHNTSTGVIQGPHHAITGQIGVTVINDEGGLIVGQNGSAVNMDTNSLVANTTYVTNYGTMLGQSANIADSDGDAIDTDGLLNLDNYGTIRGEGANGYHKGEANVSEGLAIGGGTVHNYAGATIYGYGRAIQVDNSSNGAAFAATTITNDGTIQGDGHGPTSVSAGDAAAMQNLINGAEAIDILGTFADSITNTATGQIIGGIFTDGGNDTLSNAGSIKALAGSAVNMGAGDDTVTNTGTITGNVLLGAGDDTFNAYGGSTVTGSIDGGDGNDTVNLYASAGSSNVFGQTANVETLNVESGNWKLNYYFAGSNIHVASGAAIVSGTSGVFSLQGGQTLTVDEGGLVQGTKTAIFISGGDVDANIVNSGTINVTSPAGTDKADAISLNGATATIHNTSTGVIEGGRHAITGPLGIHVINDAGGLIKGENGSAVNMDNGASESSAAFITNYGTMLGDSANISDSDGDAIDIDGILHLDNYGSVRGEGANGYHKGEANVSEGIAIGGGTIHNYQGGEIYGYGRAIQIDNSSNAAAFAAATIINDGTIEGGGHGPTGVAAADAAAMQARINGAEAIDILGTFADSITNTTTGKIIGGIFTDGGNDTLSNSGSITAMAGSAVNMGAGDDTVTNTGTGVINGSVITGAGNDSINNDGTITVTSGNAVSMGDGDDLLVTRSTITGGVDMGAGNDEVINTSQGHILGLVAFGDGNDHLSNSGNINAGAADAVAIDMGAGDDVVNLYIGATVNGTIQLGDGDDRLTADTYLNIDIHVDAGAGNDQITTAMGNDVVTGGAGDDIIFTNEGNDIVDAGAGNDMIYGGAGNDILIGGDGSDTFTYTSGGGNDLIVEGAGQEGDVDQLVLSDDNAGDMTLVRDGSDLDILLTDGSKIVVKDQFAGGGVENIVLKDGTVIDRGDIADATNRAPVVTSPSTAVTDEDTQLSGQVVATDADGDTLTYVLKDDGAHGTVSLDEHGNWVYTPAENYNGSDSFVVTVNDGHTSVDTIVNLTINPVNDAPVTVADVGQVTEHNTAAFDLTGNDTDVDNGTPHLTDFKVTGVDGINLTDSEVASAFHIGTDGQLHFDGGDLFSSLNDGDQATITVQYTATDDGGAHADGVFTLTVDGVTDLNPINGTSGTDVLFDTAGNDHISGGDGTDIIFTTSGSDLVDAGNGDDVVTAITGNATVNGGDGNDTLIGGFGNTVLNGDNGNDTIIGGSGNEVLNGGAGNDTLIANGGNDVLSGGQGNDLLVGGSGSDTFIFKPGDGNDTVLDFQASGSSHDVIEVDSHAFADFTTLMASVHDTNGGAQLEYADGSSITLTGVTKSQLVVNDFHFA